MKQKFTRWTRKLDELQNVLQTLFSDMHMRKVELEAIYNLKQWLAIESFIIAQKARINWIKVENDNSAYSLASLKVRTSRNRIDHLLNNEGKLLNDPTDIAEEISGFCKGLLGSATTSLMNVDIRCLRQGAQVSKIDADFLSRTIDRAAIRNVLFTMHDNKPPGIDVFNALFFKKCWSITGEDVYKVVIGFFETGDHPREVNCTTITLILKKAQAPTVKDYRPIACCPVIYKIISRILTTRLQRVIGKDIN